jgi:hypothetical protein
MASLLAQLRRLHILIEQRFFEIGLARQLLTQRNIDGFAKPEFGATASAPSGY